MVADLKESLHWHKLRTKAFEAQICAAFEHFRSISIEPLLIKGWLAARNYPKDHPRYFTDIDLAVSSEDYADACELLEVPEVNRLGIDLHEGFRHLDSLAWDEMVGRSEIIEIDEVGLRVPCAEDHLRILCVHWLCDGGAYKERLWDIYCAVSNRPTSFDWEKCLSVVSENRREWIICTIGLAHKYLDLWIDDLPFADEAKNIPAWMIKCIEKEWATDVRLIPLRLSLGKGKAFIEQIRKRMPPNPIQATIEMEGSFFKKPRIYYQIGSALRRTVPSIRRTIPALIRRQTKS